MPVLMMTQGPHAGTTYAVEGNRFVLGRQADCDLHDIFAQATGVSRHHACIQSIAGRYYVEDLGSRNGTLHNGKRLRERAELVTGDRLSIGGLSFEFVSLPPDSIIDSSAADVTFMQDREPAIQASRTLSKTTPLDAPLEENPGRKLQALVRLLAKIGESLGVEEVLDQLLEGLFEIFPSADEGLVALRDDGKGAVVPRSVRLRNDAAQGSIRVSQTIADRVMDAGEAILSSNAVADARFDSSRSILAQNIRSLMCAPLIDRSSRCIGIVQLDTVGEVGRFDEEDLEVLASVAPHAATAVDHARIHAERMRLQALQCDLEYARQIQHNFLPTGQPALCGYDFYAYYQAAYHVGGDYYDYVELSHGRWGVVIADVAGKGISAALLMAKFATEFKHLLFHEESLASAAERINNIMFADPSMSRFITVAAAILDPRSHALTLVNAGHTDPLLRLADGRVEEIGSEKKGTPLGLFADQEFVATELSFSAGDTLVMYTDGLSEATRSDESLYGIDRIRQQLATGPEGPRQLGEHMLAGAQQFVAGHPQSDDMCILCLHRQR